MTDEFADPANPSSIDYPPLLGRLLLFDVLAYEEHIPTVYTPPGERNPAIRANLTVLDGPTAGEVHDDIVVFPKFLISQLRSRVGKQVLGRLGQGEAKQGQTAPWRLEAATEQDKSTARAALARSTVGQASAPAQSEPPF